MFKSTVVEQGRGLRRRVTRKRMMRRKVTWRDIHKEVCIMRGEWGGGGGGGLVGWRSKCNEDQSYYDDREADFYSQFLVKCNIQQNEYTCLFHLNSNLEPF